MADGYRVSKEINGKTEQYLWDRGNMAAELNADGVVSKRYIRGLQLICDSSDRYYMHNAHGDVVESFSGVFRSVHNYTAYGTQGYCENDDMDTFGYCGQQYDWETGNYYMRARYYNPDTGRFISEDPVKDGNNWYSYCAGNPIMFWDPLGLDGIMINKEIEGAPGDATEIEHSAAFIQNSKGEWYFFSWDNKKVVFEKINDSNVLKSIDSINNYLYEKGLNVSDKGEKQKPYTDSVYIKGDFSNAFSEASNIKAEYVRKSKYNDGNPDYDLIMRNCTQVVMDILSKGILPGGDTVSEYMYKNNCSTSVIPNKNINNLQRIFYNKSTTLSGFLSGIAAKETEYKNYNRTNKIAYAQRIENIKMIRGY